MAIFDRLDRMTSRIVDRVNATSFTLTPMLKTPNGRSVRDADRNVLTSSGVLDVMSDENAIEIGARNRAGNDLRTLLINDQKPVLSVDRVRLLQEPRQGDRVEIRDYGYEVVAVRPDGLARIELQLVRVK